MAKNKFYVVWVGRSTGIFDNWTEVQASVIRFPGAKYKSFPSRAEAETAYIEPSQSLSTQPTNDGHEDIQPVHRLDSSFDIHIYCDGGCFPNPGEAGSGVVLYESGELKDMYYGLYAPNGTNNSAELNALNMAMTMASAELAEGKSVQILSDSTYSINAMTVWGADWKRADWKDRQKKPRANWELLSKMYELYCELASQIEITHVAAHIGIQGNELADRMCTLAIREKEKGLKSCEGMSIREVLAISSC